MKLRYVFRHGFGLVAALAAVPAAAASGASTLVIPPATMFGMRVVAIHNHARASAGVGPIVWDRQLAAAAEAYAAELARTGRWGHSAISSRPGQGENLWMGTRGAFSVDQMVGAWASEAQIFRRGAFPAVSRTGNWKDVAHYTQMIWARSTRVGCAVRSSSRHDYLVCRYSPAGNVMGSPVP
ncbi:MAG TPA: CAP domain-containing protein [Sphingomicrobium sp.]|nr:CAP domain-containing protein [Sphingomicrobium sp.]